MNKFNVGDTVWYVDVNIGNHYSVAGQTQVDIVYTEKNVYVLNDKGAVRHIPYEWCFDSFEAAKEFAERENEDLRRYM